MVRNEADIIADTVRHLFRQGVDVVLIADNGSTDATPDVLHDLAQRFPVYVVKDSEERFYQAQKTTLLARIAAECGADWIVPFDADEWWFGAPGERLVDTLRRADTGVASARIFNCFPADGSSGSPVWNFDPRPASLLKVAFRWHFLAALAPGNHSVVHPDQPQELLNILHFPWRDFGQFERKVRHGVAALAAVRQSDAGTGDHWEVLGRLSDEELQSAWLALLEGDAPASFLWVPQGPLEPIAPDSWEVWPAHPAAADRIPRVKVYTRSINDELYGLSSGTVALPYPSASRQQHSPVVPGATGGGRVSGRRGEHDETPTSLTSTHCRDSSTT
jgi:hypothetical protein